MQVDPGASGGRKKRKAKRRVVVRPDAASQPYARKTKPQRDRKSYGSRPVSERQAQLKSKGVLAPDYDRTVRKEHTRRVKQLREDPGARKRLKKRQERRADVARKQARVKLAEALGKAVRGRRELERQSSVTDIPGNALREARDIAKAAPSIAIEAGKTAHAIGSVAGHEIGEKLGTERGKDSASETRARKRLRGIKESVQREDPLYALGEAAVKKVKGDDKGAAKALRRAKDKAIERPISATLTAAVGGGTAVRVGNNARLAVKAGNAPTPKRMRQAEARASARPDKVVKDASQPRQNTTKADVRKARQESKERVAARQRGDTPEPVERKPNEVVVKQTYSRGVVRRRVQKARENRAVRKGRDPFELRGRKATKAVKRDFDTTARNVHAGGLLREQEEVARHKTHRKALGGDELKEAAVDLLVDKRVRRHKPKQDLRGLYREAAKIDSPDAQRNLALYERLAQRLDVFEDPDVVRVAREEVEALNRSEKRLASDHPEGTPGYFEGTDPEFTKRLRPHIARGEVELRAGRREGESPPPQRPLNDDERAVVHQDPIQTAHQPKPSAAKTGAGKPINAPRPKDPDAEAAQALRTGSQLGIARQRVAELEEGLANVRASIEAQLKVEKGQSINPNGTRTVRSVKVPKNDRAAKNLRPLRDRENGLKAELAVARRNFEIHHARLTGGKPKAEKVGGDPEGILNPAQLRREGMKSDPEQLAKGERPPIQTDEGLDTGKVDAAPKATASVQRSEPKATMTVEDVEVPEDGPGYYWTAGPKKGQRVRKEDFEGQTDLAFIRGSKEAGRDTTAPKTPQAGRGISAQEIIEGRVGDGRRQATGLERERLITLRRMNQALEHSQAHRAKDGTTRFDPKQGEKLARQLSSEGDEFTTLAIGDKSGQVLVVRKAIADRWRQQFDSLEAARIEGRGTKLHRAERAGQVLTRQFIRTVLPFSATWQVGNVMDLATRLALSDIPGNAPISRADGLSRVSRNKQVIESLDQAMAELDPHLAKELMATYRAHFGSRETVRVPRVADVTQDSKLEGLGNAVSATRDLPGVKQVGDAAATVIDGLFDVGAKAEHNLVKRAAGTSARRMGREMGLDIRDHAELGRRLAEELKADPALLKEFQRRTLEITGDYITKSAGERRLINMGVPFYKWMRAANGYVFKTLPQRHPMKVAFALWAGTLTADERAKLGLNYYLTDEQAQRMGLPQIKDGFLAGGIPVGGGLSIPTVPFTSFGEAGKWAGAAGELAGISDEGVGYKSDAGDIGFGAPLIVGRAAQKGIAASRANDSVPRAAANTVVESLVPGPKQIRRAREKGGVPSPDSTALTPSARGERNTAATALAVLSGPDARADFETPKRKKLRKAQQKVAKRERVKQEGAFARHEARQRARLRKAR